MTQAQLIEEFRNCINQGEHLIITVILCVAVICLMLRFCDKLLALPFILIKLIFCRIIEWFGKLTDCTKQEIKKRQKKVSHVVDTIEASTELADLYKPLKK